MSSVVLDASALIAVLRKEDGVDSLKPVLDGALISSVNLCEVFYKSIASGGLIEAVKWHLDSLPITSVEFDDEQAMIAASIHKATHKRGISFADRACLALGLVKNKTVWTSDKKWKELDVGADVELFR